MADVEQPGPGQGQSKSAKRRAAQKKAKEAGEAEANPPSKENTTENKKPEPKAKPAAAPAEPKAKAKGKAKAEPKEEPKPKAQPKAEPKAEPKAAAKPAAKPAAKSDAAKPKGEAKSKAAAKTAAKAKAPAKVEKVEEERPAREPSPQRFIEIDDGTGGEWEVSTGITKKQQRRKDRIEEEKAVAKAAGVKPGQAIQYIPGMGPEPKASAKAPGVSQSVSAPVNAAATAAAVAEKEKEPAAPSNTSTATVKVPESKIGIVIGPKGAKIKLIQEKTNARIDTTGEIFTITGPPDGVGQAESAIKELIEKGYCALEYEDFSEHFVAVHPSYFPEIIGKQGAVIRKIKDEVGVSVNIPSDAPKNPPANKKYKVTLAGTAAAVEKAKEVINDIIMYYHHPITHPDQVHEEIEVPAWCISFIIGKGGSELKHIQNNYKVKMNVPREQSLNKNVVIVGERWNVDRAKAYVEKVLWNAEHAPRGRDRGEGGGDDGWGDDEDVEDWMKDYLYKRR